MAARSTDELVPDFAGAFWLIEVDAQGDAGLDEQIPSTGRLEKSGEIISIGDQDLWERVRLRRETDHRQLVYFLSRSNRSGASAKYGAIGGDRPICTPPNGRSS